MTAASGSAARVTSLWPYWPLISSRTTVESKSNRTVVVTAAWWTLSVKWCHAGCCVLAAAAAGAAEPTMTKCSDKLSWTMCDALRRMARCSIDYVQRRCCQTCSQPLRWRTSCKTVWTTDLPSASSTVPTPTCHRGTCDVVNGLVRLYIRHIRSTADKNPTETDGKNFKTDENDKSAPPLPQKACDMTWSPTVSAVYGGKKIAKVSIIEFGMNEER